VNPPRTVRPLGVALVGTGMWATQIAAAARRAGLRIVTCFSRDSDRRRAFAQRTGCGAAPTLRAALEHPDVEAALILTPNDTHAEVALACAERGLGVFVEKPIADSVADAERMARACADAGVALMVGHAFRRLGAARRVAELVASGALGRVVLAEATFSLPGAFTTPPSTAAPGHTPLPGKPGEPWRAHRARNPGGPLMQLGIHHVDTLASWLGAPVAASGRFARVETDADIDDVGIVALEMASGSLAAVSGSYVSPKTFAIRLSGTRAVLDYRADFSVWPDAQRLDAVTTLTVDGSPVAFAPCDMLAEQLAEFAACVRGRAVPETGAAEAIAALRAIRAALGDEEHLEAWQPATP
jgi:UDP-N-acetyl-2-amino-2-deoxyglucuronate dehydrogenase